MGIKETTSYPFDGEDFFNNLPSPKADTPVSTSGNNFNVQSSVPNGEEIQQQSDEQEETADALFDDTVQCALVVGDYTGAVAQCLNANRIADALVIAHVGGASLWESTRDQYLKMSHSPYLKSKVRSKATEEMLRSLPSIRIDLSTFTSEYKNIQSSGVPDHGSNEMHLSKSLPETEPVDASVNLVAGCSTIHDPKGNF